MWKRVSLALLYAAFMPIVAQSHAQFLLNRTPLKVEPHNQTLILGTQAGSLSFRLTFEAQTSPAMQFKAELTGPAHADPVPLSLDSHLRNWEIDASLFPEAGQYELIHIRLEANGSTLAIASPSKVSIEVMDNILVTGVEVRELRRDELARRGYVFNQNDYRTYEFGLTLVTESLPERILLPIALPEKPSRTIRPIILEDPLRPPIQVILMARGLSERLDMSGDGPSRSSEEPVFYSLLFIPGELSFLKTHFSVACLVFNAAKPDTDFKISQLSARIQLPEAQAGGNPLLLHADPVQPVRFPGQDRVIGTADDGNLLHPGQEGRAEFVVSGELEGLYPLQTTVEGQLEFDGKQLKIQSRGRGLVYVRNADYNITVEHPEVVSLDEPYDFTMTVHNVGPVPLEDLAIHLNAADLLGCEFNGPQPSEELGDLLPGEERSITYHMRSKQTGKVIYSYLKAEGSSAALLKLFMGVGTSGEQLSSTSLLLPKSFYEQMPEPLRSQLRRYFKKVWDFSLMSAEKLPDGLLPPGTTPARSFVANMTQIAFEREAGLEDEQAFTRLAVEWLRSSFDSESLDLLRRHILTSGDLPLESGFGELLNPIFSGLSDADILERLAESAQNLRGLRIAILRGAPTLLEMSDANERITSVAGARDLPFSGILPLGPERFLLWYGGNQDEIRLKLAGSNRSLSWLCEAGGSWERTELVLPMGGVDSFRHQSGKSLLWRHDQSIEMPLDSSLQPAFPARLFFAKQFDPGKYRQADWYGRNLAFGFNVPLDLSSLEPLDQHFFINGQPVASVSSPIHQRFLVVQAPMPLGPYKPIHYEIRGLKTASGQVLPDLHGQVQASSRYLGVTAKGRVVDQNKNLLAGAKVYLMQGEPDEEVSLKDIIPLQEGEQYFPSKARPIAAETGLDEKGEYHFDFIATNNYSNTGSFHAFAFKIGVLLADGRYREQEFYPFDANGAEIRADFAFGMRGTVYGQVLDAQGQPIPFAPVYVVSQTHGQSNAVTQADDQGFYQVQDLDVGQILVKAQAGQFLGRAGAYLTALNSPLRIDVTIFEDKAGLVSGRVFQLDADQREVPLANCWVGLLMDDTFELFQSDWSYQFPYSAGTRTDETGSFRIEGLKTGLGRILYHHPNYGSKELNIEVMSGENAGHDWMIQTASQGSVSGSVRDDQGRAIAGATVQADSRVTQTDSSGRFSLNTLPLGRVWLRAEKDEWKGQTQLLLSEVSPNQAAVLITLYPPMRLSGTLKTAEGLPLPFRQIFHHFESDPAPTSKKEVSGANPHSPNWLTSYSSSYSDSGGKWTMELPLTSLDDYHAFAGGVAPGIAEVRYKAFPLGDSLRVDLVQRPWFPLQVRLLDAQGNPLVGDVKLVSDQYLRDPKQLGTSIHLGHDLVRSDANGLVTFPHVNEGPVELRGIHGLLGQTPERRFTWMTAADAAHPIELVFPQTQLAQLNGRVYDIDGVQPAPPGTKVLANVYSMGQQPVQVVTEVDAQGYYRFASLVETQEPKYVRMVYFHEASGKFYRDDMFLDQSLHFRHDVSLKGTNRLRVRVVRSDGSPVDFAAVVARTEVLEYHYNQLEILAGVRTLSRTEQITPEQAFAEFTVAAGEVQVQVRSGMGLTALRSLRMPGDDSTEEVTLRLEQPSSISGTFLSATGAAIPDAEVGLRQQGALLSQLLSSAEPGQEGRFSFLDLPMRTYQLHGEDPSSAQTAELEVTTTPYEPNPTVMLSIKDKIQLEGIVSQNGLPLAGAEISLLNAKKQTFVTGTDAAGRYRFYNLGPGFYSLLVRMEGHRPLALDTFELPDDQPIQQHDVPLLGRSDVQLTLLGPNLVPKPRVLVSLLNGIQVTSTFMTDADGKVTLPRLLRQYTYLRIYDPNNDREEDLSFNLSPADPEIMEITLELSGWGSLFGRVLDDTGSPLSRSVPVYVEDQSLSCDENGYFHAAFLPLHKDLKIRALNLETLETASQTVRLQQQGEERQIQLQFTPSSQVEGQVQLGDGAPVANASIAIFRPIYREVRTDALGRFQIRPALAGDTDYRLTTSDRTRLKRGSFKISANEEGQLQPLENLILRFDPAASISGTAHYADGSPLRQGRVSLLDSSGKRLQEMDVFRDGKWKFPPQPVGSYLLQLSNRAEPYLAAPVAVEVLGEGQNLSLALTMPDDHQVSGRLLGADGGGPLAEGWVELWRHEGTRDLRLYAGDLNDQGYFRLDRVYPGEYLLKAWNPDHSQVFEGNWSVGNGDLLEDVQLVYRSSLSGQLVDAADRPLRGTATIWQGLLTTRTVVGADGRFFVDALTPGPYLIQVEAGGGWFQLEQSGTLAGGANHTRIQLGETITLTGQAYFAGASNPRFRAEIFLEGIGRPVVMDPSGQFLIDLVPVNRALFLKLYAGSLHKLIPLGTFAQNTDLGTHLLEPIQLDATPPIIGFEDEGRTIRDLPWTMRIAVTDPDGSQILAESARVWINGFERSRLFQFADGVLSAEFPYFDSAMRRGENLLTVQISNHSNRSALQSFRFQIEQSGTLVLARLKHGTLPTAGTVSLDRGAWQTSDSTGVLVLREVAAGPHLLKAKNSVAGLRRELEVSSESLTQFVDLSLGPVGEYRGRAYDGQGHAAAGVELRLGTELEYSDERGDYRFDLIPLGAHRVIATREGWTGQTQGPVLTLPGQIAVHVDLFLQGRGQVFGQVTDRETGAAVPAIQVSLQYSFEGGGGGLPSKQTLTDANGFYRLEDVLTYEFQLNAHDSLIGRWTSVRSRLSEAGQSLQLDLALEPAATAEGRILHVDGAPASNLRLVFSFYDHFQTLVTTEADGRFRVQGLPNSKDLRIQGFDSTTGEFLDFKRYFNGLVQLGDLYLTANQPPQITALDPPAEIEPQSRWLYLNARMADDFQIERVEVRLSGVYEERIAKTIQHNSHSLAPLLLPPLPEGTLHFELTVYDFMGLSQTRTGEILVRHDLSGPVITVSAPIAGSSFAEGTLVHFTGVAIDPQDIASIELRQAGRVLVSNPYDRTFDFAIHLPSVAETTAIEFEIRAYDREGHATSLRQPLTVTAKTSTGGPSLVLLSPIEDMPLPLHLGTGLNLQLAARFQDPDGLAAYQWRQGENLLAEGLLEGTDQTAKELVHLPGFDPDVQELQLELIAYDLGDNPTRMTFWIRHIEGIEPTQPLTASYSGPSLEGLSLILNGGTHILDGQHTYQNLILVNGAVLQQSPTTDDESLVAGTRLSIAEKLVIEGSSAIRMDGTGFPHKPAEMAVNPNSAYAGSRNESGLEQIYGSFLQPNLPGSNRGGGQLRIHSQEYWLAGELSASSRVSTDGAGTALGSYGSGGSIWLSGDSFHGLGAVRANGFIERDAIGAAEGSGSGGRIRIDGDFAGTVEALGAQDWAPGTIYRRIPDANHEDGFLDRLTIAGRKDIPVKGFTTIPVSVGLVVGSDVHRAQIEENGQIYEILEFLTAGHFPWKCFEGMRIYRDGDAPNGDTIEIHRAGLLRSPIGGHFGQFGPGDRLRIDFQVDEIEVRDGAAYRPSAHQSQERVLVADALFDAPQASENPDSSLVLAGEARFNGSSLWGHTDTSALESLKVNGHFAARQLNLTHGLHQLNGRIEAEDFQLQAGSILELPQNQVDGIVKIQAMQMAIAGLIRASNQHAGQHNQPYAHGGMAVNHASLPFGSLYEPSESGGGKYNVGGFIQLDFETLVLDGSLDASAGPNSGLEYFGAGGSILLNGRSLSGTGRILANASPLSQAGGGRIAIRVEQTTGFSGTVEARQDLDTRFGAKHGATGTIYYRTAEWPLGRLLIDQHGLAPDGTAKTLLPGLGQRVATSATGGGPTLSGENFPHNLAGLHLLVPGHTPVPIASNSANELRAAAGHSFPALQPGDSYSGLHLLDNLEVANSAIFSSPDPIRLTGTAHIHSGAQVVDGTLVESQASETLAITSGDSELPSGAFFPHVTVDNATLRIGDSARVGLIELGPNALLVIGGRLEASELRVQGGNVQFKNSGDAPALIADRVELRNGARWTVAPRQASGLAYPLIAHIRDTLLIDPTSSIRAQGSDVYPLAERPWNGLPHDWRGNGGFPILQANNGEMVGSFAQPDMWSKHMAGQILISAGALQLEGEITADAPEIQSGHALSGGSILLETPQLSGTGLIAARGHKYGGGGRIAIHCGEDTAFLKQLRIYTHVWNPPATGNLSGDGTLFVKRASQTYGELILDQRMPANSEALGIEKAQRLQGITGLPSLRAETGDVDPNPLVLRDLSWNQLPPGLAGLVVRMEIDAQVHEARIADNTPNSLTLLDPLPSLVPAGTLIEFLLKLDRLVLKNGAMLHFPGIVAANELVSIGASLNSIWARDYQPAIAANEPFRLQNQRLRLVLEEPLWDERDLDLEDASLYFDKPIRLRDVRLTNSWICRSQRPDSGYSTLFQPSLDFAARDLNADSSSGFRALEQGLPWDGTTASSHGGFNGSSPTYGNLFYPTLPLAPPFPHAQVRIQVRSMSGGWLDARSLSNQIPGPALEFQAERLAGDLHFDASATDSPAGRIAVHYDLLEPGTSLHFDTRSSTERTINHSAGTAFHRSGSDRFGHLIVDQGLDNTRTQATPIPSFGPFSLTPTFSLVSDLSGFRLKVPGLSLSENFRDYYLAVNGDPARSARILDSSQTAGGAEFILASDPGPLNPGDTIQAALWLDSLSLGPNCKIEPAGLLIFEDQPPRIDLVDIPPDILPGTPFQVRVSASDNLGVQRIQLQFLDQTLESSSPSALFELLAPSPVSPTSYEIRITAFDKMGLSTTSIHQARVLETDTTPPLATVLEPTSNASIGPLENFTVRIRASDNRALARLDAHFNQTTQSLSLTPLPLDQELSFNWTAPRLEQDSDLPLDLLLTDAVGLTHSLHLLIHIRGEAGAASSTTPIAYINFNNLDLDSANQPLDLIGGAYANRGSAYTGRAAPFGQSFGFGNLSLKSEFPHIPPLEHAITVAAWLKVTSFKDNGGILSFGNEAAESWALVTQKTGGDRIGFSVGGELVYSAPLFTNTWYYAVATFNRGIAALYINGLLQNERPLSLAALPAPSSPWLVCGLHHPGADEVFDGEIDEALIWDRSLTAPQILADYEAWQSGSADFKPPEPVADLTAAPETTALNLEWRASPNRDGDLAGYRILVEGMGEFETIDNHIRIAELTPRSLYRVRVAAIDSKGNRHRGLSTLFATDCTRSELEQPFTYYSFDQADTLSPLLRDLRGNIPACKLIGSGAGSGLWAEAATKAESLDSPLNPLGLPAKRFALSTWFSLSGLPSNATLFSYGSKTQELLSIHFENLDGWGLRLQLGDRSATTFIRAGAPLANNGAVSTQLKKDLWYHLGVIFDQGQVQIYLNGELAAEGSLPASALGQHPLAFMAFGASTLQTYSSTGKLDEFMLWDRGVDPYLFALQHQLGRKLAAIDFRPPNDVLDLKAQATETSLNLNWSAPTVASPDLSHYLLTWNGQVLANPAATATAIQLGGLQPGMLYELRLKPVDLLGNTGAGVELLAATLPTQFPQPHAYWSFDNADSSKPLDLSGNLTWLAGTANQTQAGIYGQSSQLYYSETTPPKFDLHQGFSLAFWLFANTWSSDNTLFSLGNRSNEAFSISQQGNGGNRIRFQFGDKGTASFLDAGAWTASNGQLISQMGNSRWYHLAASWENNRLALYIDGKLANEQAFAPNALPDLHNLFLSMGRRTTTQNQVSARVDDMLLLNQPLSAHSVALLYQLGRAGLSLKGPELDLKPPSEITQLAVTPGATALSLQWSAPTDPDLFGFRLYLDEQLIAELDAQTTQFQLDGLQPSSLYELRVRCLDRDGNESGGYRLPAATMPELDSQLPQPVSYWSLDSESRVNGLFKDLLGRNSASISTGTLQPLGQVRGAFEFSASTHKIEVPGSSSLDTLETLTAATWVYVKTWTQNAGLLTYADETVETFGLVLGNDNGNYFRFQSKSGATLLKLDTPRTTGPNGSDLEPPVANRWYHVAASFDRGSVRILVNGRQLASGNWSLAALPLSSLRKLVMGLHHPGTDVPFKGYLDEVAIWNRALTEAELRVYYLRGQRASSLLQGLSDAKQESSLSGLLRSPQSFEDFDHMVLVDEDLQLRDFQTSKRLWLHNSRLEVDGRLEAASIHLLDGSLLSHPSREFVPGHTVLAAQQLQIDRHSRIDLDGRGRVGVDPGVEATATARQVPGAQDPSPAPQLDPLSDYFEAVTGLNPSFVPELRKGRPLPADADGGSMDILVHELILDGEIRARALGRGRPGSLWVAADLLEGSGHIIGKRALQPHAQELQMEPAQDHEPKLTHDLEAEPESQAPKQPEPFGDAPLRENKAILPKNKQRPRTPSSRGSGQSPANKPCKPVQRDEPRVLRIKDKRKQRFPQLNLGKPTKR